MFKIESEAKGLVSHGVSACHGCGLEIIFRNTLDVLGSDTVIVIPPGCSAMFSGYGDETAVKIAGMQGNLENSAAYAAGIKASFEMQGNFHTKVLAFAGDGGTVDIGLQALSGALERRDDIIYICYDNEAYMNTGIQGSSSTPMGASTTTTPAGKPTMRKDILRIVEAHDVPYAASASVANINDMRKKLQKCKDLKGPCFMHIHAPCPTGWFYPSHLTFEVARKAVETGSWILYEIENGKRNVTYKPKELKPIGEYFDLQKRFKGITEEEKAEIQESVRKRYDEVVASAQ